VASAHDDIAVDEAVGDPAAVVRADIVDDDQPAAREPADRDLACAGARREQRTDRNRIEIEVFHLGARVARVVAELVEKLRGDRAHAPNMHAGSDSPPTGRYC